MQEGRAWGQGQEREGVNGEEGRRGPGQRERAKLGNKIGKKQREGGTGKTRGRGRENQKNPGVEEGAKKGELSNLEKKEPMGTGFFSANILTQPAPTSPLASLWLSFGCLQWQPTSHINPDETVVSQRQPTQKNHPSASIALPHWQPNQCNNIFTTTTWPKWQQFCKPQLDQHYNSSAMTTHTTTTTTTLP